MALTVQVTKVQVRLTQPGRYSITLNLKCLDGAIEVISHDFEVERSAGETVASKVTVTIAKMQEVIDTYKAEQQIFTSALLNTAVTNIQAGLVG